MICPYLSINLRLRPAFSGFIRPSPASSGTLRLCPALSGFVRHLFSPRLHTAVVISPSHQLLPSSPPILQSSPQPNSPSTTSPPPSSPSPTYLASAVLQLIQAVPAHDYATVQLVQPQESYQLRPRCPTRSAPPSSSACSRSPSPPVDAVWSCSSLGSSSFGSCWLVKMLSKEECFVNLGLGLILLLGLAVFRFLWAFVILGFLLFAFGLVCNLLVALLCCFCCCLFRLLPDLFSFRMLLLVQWVWEENLALVDSRRPWLSAECILYTLSCPLDFVLRFSYRTSFRQISPRSMVLGSFRLPFVPVLCLFVLVGSVSISDRLSYLMLAIFLYRHVISFII